MVTTVWIVGQIKNVVRETVDWELGGVFSTRGKAVAACTEPTDCVWPVTVDEFLGRATVAPPPGMFCPLAPEDT